MGPTMTPSLMCQLKKTLGLLSLLQLLIEYGLAGDATGFLFNTQSGSWNRARRTCEAYGGQLASIRTQRDFDAIENLKTESPAFQVHEYWIGLHRSASGFVWADCSSPRNLNFDQWAIDHPGTGGCVYVLQADTNWYTATCELNKHFICEKDTGDCTFGLHVDQTSYGDQGSALETASSVLLSECKARCNNYNSQPSCEYIVYTSVGDCYLHSTEPAGLTAGPGSDKVYRRNCYSRIHEYWNLVQPEIAGDTNTEPSTDTCQDVAQPGQGITDTWNTSQPPTTDGGNVVRSTDNCETKPPADLVELARGKPTKQSGTTSLANSDLAVDGSTTSGADDTCTRSDLSVEPWWMVDLGGLYLIKEVAIFPRTDEISMKNFTITVSQYWDSTSDGMVKPELCYTTKGELPSGVCSLLPCYSPLTARYVRIMRFNDVPGALALCEVKVYGITTKRFFFVTPRPGKRSQSRLLAAIRTASQVSCSASCRRYLDCTSFNMAAVDGVCELMADPLEDPDGNEVTAPGWTRYVIG